MNLQTFGQIVLSVSLTALAQISLRKGMVAAGVFDFAKLGPTVLNLALIPWIWAGLFLYAVSILIWLSVLSKVPVSVAYPFSSLGFIITALIGALFLAETITPSRIVGILFIAVGLFCMGRPS
jgi:drug/metabolite transporter (DMT)-like permease